MLGGLIVELDGKILDGSLRQRLREVKEVMNT
jgi:F0F1-type ATP synthase delta subunit